MPPPTTHIPSSTAASFLLKALHAPTPPFRTLRIPTQSLLQPSQRPRRAVTPITYPHTCSRHFSSSPQCRIGLKLYVVARSKTPLGQHKILSYTRFDPPALSESPQKIKLWRKQSEGDKPELIASNISFQELYDQHIKPGFFLIPTSELDKKLAENFEQLKSSNTHQTYRNYYLVERRTDVPVSKKQKTNSSKTRNSVVRDIAQLKQIHFKVSATPSVVKSCLDSAYAFLERGHTVEFGVRLADTIVDKKRTKEERYEPAADMERFPWLYTWFPSMRPDFIMAGMPAGTYFAVEPFSDGANVKWVFARELELKVGVPRPRRAEYTESVLRMQDLVRQKIEAGSQGELPSVVRKKLIEEGHEGYSLDTGRPKRVMEKIPHRRLKPRWGKESLVKDPEWKKMKKGHDSMKRADREKVKAADERWLAKSLEKSRGKNWGNY